MSEVSPLPSRGEVLVDARDDGRELRISCHDAADVVVLSLWRSGVCTATFRLPREQVPALVDALVQSLVPRTLTSRFGAQAS
jgi:hypothetical protein